MRFNMRNQIHFPTGASDHLPGRALRMYRGLAGATVGAHRAGPQNGRLSHHRRDIGRNVRVRDGVRPDVGRL